MFLQTDENKISNQNIYGELSKRVSFNEDLLRNKCNIKELELSCDNLNLNNSNLLTKEECIIDQFFEKNDIRNKQRKLCSHILYSPLKSRNSLTKSVKCNSLDTLIQKKHYAKIYFPSFSETDPSERQEDSKKCFSVLSLNNSDTASNLSHEFFDSTCLTESCRRRYNSSKSLLVKKFLESIASRKLIKENISHGNNKISLLYIKNIKLSDKRDQSVITNIINDEIKKNKIIEINIEKFLNPSVLILFSIDKFIYKVYRVLSVNGCPLLAVITCDFLYFIKYRDNSFVIEYSCNFRNLLAAVINTFSQIIAIINYKKEKFIFNSGIPESLNSPFISHLELAIRRFCSSKRIEFSFSVAIISEIEQAYVYYKILRPDTFLKDEILIGMYPVWLQQDFEPLNSPLGPQKEGHLMTKIGLKEMWKPVYICLRGGILYVFKNVTSHLPKFTISLNPTFCKECIDLKDNSDRPYSFEIILNNDQTICFGASDEYELNDWIRLIQISVKQFSDNLIDHKIDLTVLSCWITLTNRQILLHKFSNEIISRALLSDVIKLRKSGRINSFYCILELNCREASEIGDDWILHFVCDKSYESFCNNFSHIDFKSLIDDPRLLTNYCDKINAQIRTSWNSFFI